MSTEEQRTRKRAEYHRNRDKYRAKRAIWRRQNKAKIQEESRLYYLNNRSRIAQKYRDRMLADPTRRRANVLKKYGLTHQSYRECLDAQGMCCAICTKSFIGLTSKQIQLDHDHATGRFRAALCHHCNIMLGGARDKQATLQAAITYLDKRKVG